jgi:hypothetical protein
VIHVNNSCVRSPASTIAKNAEYHIIMMTKSVTLALTIGVRSRLVVHKINHNMPSQFRRFVTTGNGIRSEVESQKSSKIGKFKLF